MWINSSNQRSCSLEINKEIIMEKANVANLENEIKRLLRKRKQIEDFILKIESQINIMKNDLNEKNNTKRK